MIAVVIAAANLIVRVGLESIVRSHPSLEFAGSAPDLAAIAQQVQETQPDAVLLEWSFSDSELAWEQLAISNGAAAPAIVVLADGVEDGVGNALSLGVRGVLPRSATPDEIAAAVVAAAAGLVVLHPEVVEALIPVSHSTVRVQPSPLQALTAREIEVLGMLAEGLGNKAIARQLNISEHTVKFHVSSIFQKLNASSRTEAVTLGARLGLILL